MYGFQVLTVYFLFIWITSLEIVNGAQDPTYLDGILDPVKADLSIWHPRTPRVVTTTNEQLACEKPNVYICEEPPETVPADEGKLCDYRNVRYHEQVYRWVAGRGCLLYTPDFLYVAGHNTIHLRAGCYYGPWFAPCLEVVKEDGTCGCFPFDPSFEEVANTVREALIPAAHGRWEKCFYTASDCCAHVMVNNINVTDDSQCEATFDGWTCWDAAPSDSVVNEVCSEFAYSNVGPSCHHYSNKQCFSNGTWELQTDYTTCSITPRLLRRYRMNIAVLSFSIASCLPAIFIFFFYKRLRVTRVALHRNLLIAIIIRNALVILSRSEVYIAELTSTGDTVLSINSAWCRTLAVCERLAANAVFVCMLVEGVYLHRLIVAVFRKNVKLRWLYGVGAIIAIVPVLCWAVVMSLLNDHSCWIVYTVDHVQWILDAPRIAVILINSVLLIDILRVLLTKLRNSENANQLSTVKATLFLMPLFGTQFLLTAFRPSTTNCTWEQVYYYFSYTLEGLQGFIVALLYCYINKEVHALLKATYKKTESAVNSRVRGTNSRVSVDPNSVRRFTYSTNLPSHNVEDIKDHYMSMKPKLHVAEIITIQASERLAEILDPVYETVDSGLANQGYDFLTRPEQDNDSGIIPNRGSNTDEDYSGTKISNFSIDYPDWLRPDTPDTNIINEQNASKSEILNGNVGNDQRYEIVSLPTLTKSEDNNISDNNDTVTFIKDYGSGVESEYEDCENMLDEIMQYIDTNEKRDLVLDPNILSPNRKSNDRIIFVDE